jgi:hypothetical protein
MILSFLFILKMINIYVAAISKRKANPPNQIFSLKKEKIKQI